MILNGSAADHCSSNSYPRLPNVVHALQALWAPTPMEFTQFVSALFKPKRIRKSCCWQKSSKSSSKPFLSDVTLNKTRCSFTRAKSTRHSYIDCLWCKYNLCAYTEVCCGHIQLCSLKEKKCMQIEMGVLLKKIMQARDKSSSGERYSE